MSKYEDDLDEALGVHNPIRVMETYDCPVITFVTGHRHAHGHSDHRAEIHALGGGKKRTKTLRAHSGATLKASREANLELAKEWAAKFLGIAPGDWAPTGLPNSWMPKEAKARMTADLRAWRKRQAESEESSQ